MFANETWKKISITGLERYSVSNYGNVRNDETNYIFSTKPNTIGYNSIHLSNGTRKVPCLVHRLVATEFLPTTDLHLVVDHIDGNRSNNHVSNLRWVTQKENKNNPNSKATFGKRLYKSSNTKLVDSSKYQLTAEDLAGEIWIDKLSYSISSLGRVKTTTKKGIRVGSKNAVGYMVISIHCRPFLIHRLVADAFLPNPDGLPIVDHISGDTTDNRVCNLRWVTHKENKNNPNTVQTDFTKSIASNKDKLSKPIVRLNLDGSFVDRWDSLSEATNSTGIVDISLNVLNKSASCGGYLFIFEDEYQPDIIAKKVERFNRRTDSEFTTRNNHDKINGYVNMTTLKLYVGHSELNNDGYNVTPVRSTCSGYQPLYKGDVWKFVEDCGIPHLIEEFEAKKSKLKNKSIVKCSMTGELLSEHEDVYSLIEEGYDKRTVYMVCNLENTKVTSHKGVSFMYFDDYNDEEKRNNRFSNMNRRAIAQYDLEGNFIRRYERLKDVLEYGFTKSGVCACCSGKLKSSLGFTFKYL